MNEFVNALSELAKATPDSILRQLQSFFLGIQALNEAETIAAWQSMEVIEDSMTEDKKTPIILNQQAAVKRALGMQMIELCKINNPNLEHMMKGNGPYYSLEKIKKFYNIVTQGGMRKQHNSTTAMLDEIMLNHS